MTSLTFDEYMLYFHPTNNISMFEKVLRLIERNQKKRVWDFYLNKYNVDTLALDQVAVYESTVEKYLDSHEDWISIIDIMSKYYAEKKNTSPETVRENFMNDLKDKTEDSPQKGTFIHFLSMVIPLEDIIKFAKEHTLLFAKAMAYHIATMCDKYDIYDKSDDEHVCTFKKHIRAEQFRDFMTNNVLNDTNFMTYCLSFNNPGVKCLLEQDVHQVNIDPIFQRYYDIMMLNPLSDDDYHHVVTPEEKLQFVKKVISVIPQDVLDRFNSLGDHMLSQVELKQGFYEG